MATYAGTTTLVEQTVVGNKRVSLLKVNITNYNATGIPLTARIAGLNVIESVLPYFTGVPDEAADPIHAVYIPASRIVTLYSAVNVPVADDTDLNSDVILVYLVVTGV